MARGEMSAAGTTCDIFLGGRLRLMQPGKGYRAGLDAVLLAAASDVRTAGARVLDAGAGVGTAGLCLTVRRTDVDVTLVEMAPELAALARLNVESNGLGARARVVEADLRGRSRDLAARGLAPETFAHVIANPPYLDTGRFRLPADPVAAGAFGMAADDLRLWASFLGRMAAPGGGLTMIHRADALAAVLAAIETKFGDIAVLPLHPRAGEAAHRILVSARKGSKAPLRLLRGLELHEADNRFVPEIEAVLRDGAALGWSG